jgi:hypothetical protein
VSKPFKLCILFGDGADRPVDQIVPGWEMAEVPLSIMIQPFSSETVWKKTKAQIKAWKLPPIRVASHFLSDFGLVATGPGVDWDQLKFWSGRAFPRLAELGVKTAGVYGSFFKVVPGFSKTKTMDQAIKFCRLIGDLAKKHNMQIALEPMGAPNSLWPLYRDGLEFMKKVNHKSVKVMADLAYFLERGQALEDILIAPEACLHVHMAGVHGQPGLGDRVEVHTRLFRILRDIKYTGGVSAACPWASSIPGQPLNFGEENAKSLAYMKMIRDKVYAE